MKTIFRVRVITRDIVTNTFAKLKSITGGRIKSYEKAIQAALEELYNEMLTDYPNIQNIKLVISDMFEDEVQLVVYGDISDEEYKEYIHNKRNKKR